MLALQERAREEPARAADEQPQRHASPNRVHNLQRTVGNRALRRALQRQARVVGPKEPSEVEAERIAANVVGSSGFVGAPRRCACGGVVLGGGECARCRGERLQRRASKSSDPGPAIATPAVDRVLGMPGRPLDAGARSFMEPRFGVGFDDVRVHTGKEAAAAATSVHADAFTVGSDIVFGEGRYAPEAHEGRQLLAHELTHVTQHAEGPPRLSRQYSPGMMDPDYWTFQTRVFDKATARLRENDAKLDEWRTFIDKQFDDLELKGQLGATESLGLIQRAYSGHRMERLEPYFAAVSPASRRLEEATINHEINGGCQRCHEEQVVWRWNAEHSREFANAGTTAQQLWRLGDHAEFRRMMKGGAPMVNRVDPTGMQPMQQLGPGSMSDTEMELISAWMGGSETPRAPAQVATPTTTTATTTTTPTATPPAQIEYPKPRSDLCGSLPPAEPQPTFDPALLGPNTALALAAIERIQPVLQPLGPQGYRVLPTGIFSDLYRSTPAELRAMVMDKIAERQGKYRGLQAKIADDDVPYHELCPIVDELLPSTTSAVQAYVLYDIEYERITRMILDIIMALVGAALLLLTIMLPPVAFVVGTALAAVQLAMGIGDVRRGTQWEMGTGAGIYSPRQEAEAPGLIVGGWLNIGMGAVGLATAGFSIGNSMRGRPVVTAIEPTRGAPSGRFTPLADGSYMAIHPQNPNLVIMQEGSMLRAGPMIEGELIPIFEARAPWGSGPPPGTPTWAEFSAGWGSAAPAGGGGFRGFGQPQGLLSAGPEPFGLLGPGEVPSGLLPAGRTPLLIQGGPEPFGLLGPGEVPFGLLPAGPAPPLQLGTGFPGGAPRGLLGPGSPTTLTLQQVRRLPRAERGPAGEVYISELYGNAPRELTHPIETPGRGFRRVDVTPGDALEVKNYGRWTTVQGQAQERTVPLSRQIQQQIDKDTYIKFRDKSYRPVWIFLHAPPSAELAAMLSARGIPYVIYF